MRCMRLSHTSCCSSELIPRWRVERRVMDMVLTRWKQATEEFPGVVDDFAGLGYHCWGLRGERAGVYIDCLREG